MTPQGTLALRDVADPVGEDTVEILACGLCGSDLEKLTPAFAGRVLGHEVVGRTVDGRRVALIHHAPCGTCERCRTGHETTCATFPIDTIMPGGFAERTGATAGWVDIPEGVSDEAGTAIEPLACVLRGLERVPRGRVLVVGRGFVGQLFERLLARRGDTVFGLDRRPERTGHAPDGPVDAVVLAAPGGVATALEHLAPGGTLLLFADAGEVPADPVYRRELRVVGSRSSTPETMRQAAELLQQIELPELTTVPLSEIAHGVDLVRSGQALKVVVRP